MIAIDSNVVIYILERNPRFFKAAKSVFVRALRDQGGLCVSVLTITEIVAGSQTAPDLTLLEQPDILISPVDKEIAHRAGVLRRQHRLKTPDALHLATAIQCGASEFVTNDYHLTRLKTAIRIVSLTDYGTNDG